MTLENIGELFTSHLDISRNMFYPVEDYSSSVQFGEKQESVSIPVGIFDNFDLSCLETISKYLKEKRNLKYCEIAGLLNRDDRTIWGAYSAAKKKMPQELENTGPETRIPLSIFQDRNLSILEALTKYLKEEMQLRYCDIAALLNRNERTIWTVYNRSQKKVRRLYESG